jgi:hypothetical protein
MGDTISEICRGFLVPGGVLGGDTWAVWRSILLAAMGEPLTNDELDVFRRLTGRNAPPGKRCEELLVVAGRRGGKTLAISALAIYLAGCAIIAIA